MYTSTRYRRRPDIDSELEVNRRSFLPHAANKIFNKLQGKAGRKRLEKPTPGELKHIWAKNLLIDAKIVQPPKAHPPWSDPSPAHLREVSVAPLARQKQMQKIKARQLKVWNDS